MKSYNLSIILLLAQKNKKYTRFLLLAVLFQICYPLRLLALTSGPSNPDFTSFEPVTTNSMVNESTGDFTYNLPVIDIPGANGGGYSLSLSYHSGNSPETESSWVGYGWTLNPGAINRSKNGIADDIKGEPFSVSNSLKPNRTFGVSLFAGVSLQTFSLMALSLGASHGIRWNNYRGIGFTKGVSLNLLNGLVSTGYDVVDNQGVYRWTVDANAILKFLVARTVKHIKRNKMDKIRNESNKKVEEICESSMTDQEKDSKIGEEINNTSKQLNDVLEKFENTEKRINRSNPIATMSSSHYYTNNRKQLFSAGYNTHKYNGYSIQFNHQITGNATAVPIGFSGTAIGSYSQQKGIDYSHNQYGFLYSGNAGYTSDNDNMMDYNLEKEGAFNGRDQFLNIPYSAKDNFIQTGEGLSGGFKFHSKRASFYRPAYMRSDIEIFNTGADINVGWDNGIGVTASFGESIYKMRRPHSGNNYVFLQNFQRSPEINNLKDRENYFLHYKNDRGGNITFGDPFSVASPSPNGGSSVFGAFDNQSSDFVDGIQRTGASSYLNYHTNGEMNTLGNGKRVIAQEKNNAINSLAGRNNAQGSAFNDKIGEIISYNEVGNKYVYGLPVYSFSEKHETVQYPRNIEAPAVNNNNNYFSVVPDNALKNSTLDNSVYASSYLLTQITTPDYLDKTADGPSDDDLGGYTKFSYKPVHTSTTKGVGGFHWRAPYVGAFNAQGTFTKKIDDMHTYSSGDKEIYNLQTIETKTHVAVFVTNKTNFTLGGKSIIGSMQDRWDGVEAAVDNSALANYNAVGTKKLEKLERIELYSKNLNPVTGNVEYHLVKKVLMAYDYEVWPGTLNSITSGENPNKGKLTLRKVWFEYNGISPAQISPYKFYYQYPTSGYPSAYASLQMTGLNETPQYTLYNDAWGNYQLDGLDRLHNYKLWLNQVPTTGFDPAAWELKRIALPSGGAIDIQYEQKDYSYVQNKPAMAMVNLLSGSSSQIELTNKESNPEFILNAATIGANTVQEKVKLVSEIDNFYKGKSIYFKFLFSGKGPGEPDVNDCNSEYVDGYAEYHSCFLSGTDVILKLKGEYDPFTANPSKKDVDLPAEFGESFMKEEIGITSPNADGCTQSTAYLGDNKGQILRSINDIIQEMFAISPKSHLVRKTNYAKSYFKVPINFIRDASGVNLRGKFGGGVRVKRLLMYDKGIDAGDQSLYGTEYFYLNNDATSSGVATNEPASIHNENALIGIIDKRGVQTNANKAYGGYDKEQFEGPLGEELLPQASITYARVITQSINQNHKSGTGFSINEYYTTKDFPFETGVKVSEISKLPYKENIPILVGTISHKHYKASQGYTFVMNNMNGLPRKISNYSGNYTIDKDSNPLLQGLPSLTSSVDYEYFDPPNKNGYGTPAEKIPIYDFKNHDINLEEMGKEMEVAVEEKEIKETTYDVGVSGDITYAYPFFFWPIPLPMVNRSTNVLYTTVSSKVTDYPAILKSTTTTQEGFSKTVSNIAFDKYTGNPVLTRSTDSYHGKVLQQSNGLAHNGTYTSYMIPASAHYTEMAQKAMNEDYVTATGNYTCLNGAFGTKTISLNPDEIIHFCFGDFVQINTGSYSYYCHVDQVDFATQTINVIEAGNYSSTLPTGTVSNIRVITSGRTNQLKANIGKYIKYGKSKASPSQFINNLTSLVTTGSNGGVIDMDDYGFKIFLTSVLNGGGGSTSSYSRCNCEELHAQYGYNYSNQMPAFRIKMISVEKIVGTSNYRIKLFNETNDLIGISDLSAAGYAAGSSGLSTIANATLFDFNAQLSNSTNNTLDKILRLNPGGNASFTKLCFAYSPTNMIGMCGRDDNTWNSNSDALIELCPNFLEKENVIEASAITLKGDWTAPEFAYTLFNPTLNKFENGAKGRWYPFETYVYKEKIIPGARDQAPNTERIYKDAGVFPFIQFNWANPSQNLVSKWIKTTTVTSIDNNGNPVEERDIDNIYSAAKFGYGGILPYILGQNTRKQESFFESFEYVQNNNAVLQLEDFLVKPSSHLIATNGTQAHSGKGYLSITSPGGINLWQNIPYTPSSPREMTLRLWVKMDDKNYESYQAWGGSVAGPIIISWNGGISPISVVPSYTARSGDWALLTAKVDLQSVASPVTYNLKITKLGSSTIHLDDIIYKPSKSQTTAYVYDVKNYRLITSFDDRHFGLFYQYDAQGKLIRKIAETERGKKTITETLYNTSKEIPDEN